MLIRRDQLDAIRAGAISLQFRRWRRPTVKAGGTLKTSVGVLGIDAVDIVDPKSITPAESRAAGYPSLAALHEHLGTRDEGQVYRVRLRFVGDDPRIALRDNIDEIAAIPAALAKLDAHSRHGPWTRATLDVIHEHPGIYSGIIADQLGFERLWLKAQIRKLKALGLTESLEVGYRLSPRGVAVLRVTKAR